MLKNPAETYTFILIFEMPKEERKKKNRSSIKKIRSHFTLFQSNGRFLHAVQSSPNWTELYCTEKLLACTELFFYECLLFWWLHATAKIQHINNIQLRGHVGLCVCAIFIHPYNHSLYKWLFPLFSFDF